MGELDRYAALDTRRTITALRLENARLKIRYHDSKSPADRAPIQSQFDMNRLLIQRCILMLTEAGLADYDPTDPLYGSVALTASDPPVPLATPESERARIDPPTRTDDSRAECNTAEAGCAMKANTPNGYGVSGKIPDPGSAPRPKRPSGNEERDAWMYDEFVKGTPLAKIATDSQLKAKEFGWEPVHNPSSVTMAMNRAAKRWGIDSPAHGQITNDHPKGENAR